MARKHIKKKSLYSCRSKQATATSKTERGQINTTFLNNFF